MLWRVKSRRGKNFQFFDKQLQISDWGDYGYAQHFNFAPKLFQNGGFRPQIWHFGRQFSDKKTLVRQFSDSPKFRGTMGTIAPPLLHSYDAAGSHTEQSVSNNSHTHKIYTEFWLCLGMSLYIAIYTSLLFQHVEHRIDVVSNSDKKTNIDHHQNKRCSQTMTPTTCLYQRSVD